MPDWQTIAVLMSIVLAGHFIVHRLMKMARGGTHACGSCAPKESASRNKKPIVPLDVPDQRR